MRVTGVCAFLWVVAGECGWVSCVCRVGTSKELGSCSGSGLVREGFEGYESLCVFFEDENDENDETDSLNYNSDATDEGSNLEGQCVARTALII